LGYRFPLPICRFPFPVRHSRKMTEEGEAQDSGAPAADASHFPFAILDYWFIY